MYYRNMATLCLFVWALPLPAIGKNKVKIDGRLRGGVEVTNFSDGETQNDVKIEIKGNSDDKSKARIVLKKYSDEEEIVVERAYLERELNERQSFEFGLNKKKLGLEYQLSERRRLYINRSIIYEKLESFGYVGTETSFRLSKSADREKGDLGYDLSLGYADSLDANLTFYLHKACKTNYDLGMWLLLQSDRVNGKRQAVWSSVFSLWSHHDLRQYEIEIASGQDPDESEFEKSFKNGDNVYFYGLKLAYSYASMLFDRKLLPVAALSYLIHDHRYPDYNTVSALTGLSYLFTDDFTLSVNIEGIGSNSKITYRTRTWNNSRLTIETAYYF